MTAMLVSFGTKFREYKLNIILYIFAGTDYVNKTPIETEHNWVNVSGLIHGALYEFGVVAMNRKGDSMRSDLKKHKVGVRERNIIYI